MGVVENMKEVADLIKKIGDIELNRKILTLETEVLDLTREKRRLEEKAEELERRVAMREKLIFIAPFYWLGADATPYCAACWENQNRAVHVIFRFDNGEDARLDCPVCKHMYLLRSGAWREINARRPAIR